VSVVFRPTFIALVVAHLVSWENLGEMFGYMTSIRTIEFCASIMLILAAYAAATHTSRPGKSL
jgi:hypothetical protein